MSGPPDRVAPAGIGQFIIGVSPIGGAPPFDVWDTIISQYSNSPILTGLIERFAMAMDEEINWQAFFDKAWNVDTAQGWGLDVWGRIVGVSRILSVSNDDYFGFDEAGSPGTEGFDIAPFYNDQTLTSNFSLTDDAFRQLIIAKAAANICDGSIPAINQILLMLFPGRGNCYVEDNLDMSMTYKFEFALSPVDAAIVESSGVLPQPTGVSITYDIP